MRWTFSTTPKRARWIIDGVRDSLKPAPMRYLKPPISLNRGLCYNRSAGAMHTWSIMHTALRHDLSETLRLALVYRLARRTQRGIVIRRRCCAVCCMRQRRH